MIRTRLIILLILGLSFHKIYGQKQSETIRKNQIDFFLGGSNIKKFYDATSFGIGIDHRFEKLIVISSQFLVSRKYIRLLNESDLYYNIDLLAGLYQTYNRIEVSINSGIGLAMRNEGDIATNREKSYLLIGIPIRLKINYLIKQRLSAGISAYGNLNSGNSLYCFDLNVGYRF
jgi:hypothetical protein